MFYIWHTLLITAFVGIAYYLGFKHGIKAKAIKKSKAIFWKALKQSPATSSGSVGPIIKKTKKIDLQSDWLKGYWKWRKTNQKQNDLTQK